jgi:hypothetical protein
MSKILCPLCNEPVLSNESRPNKIIYVEDYEIDNFHCPTYVKVRDGLRSSEYTRYSFNGAQLINNYTRYMIVILPFEIYWYSNGDLVVYQLDPKVSLALRHVRTQEQILFTKKDVKFEELPKVYERFKILRAFS